MSQSLRHPGFSEAEVRAQLRECIAKYGSAAAVAQALEVSPAFLSSVMTGRAKPSPRVLAFIGLRHVDRYVPANEEDE